MRGADFARLLIRATKRHQRGRWLTAQTQFPLPKKQDFDRKRSRKMNRMGNSKRMTSGRDLDRNPHTGVRLFSMLKVDVVFLSKISLAHARMGHSR